jgi:signal transduction histidine kinase
VGLSALTVAAQVIDQRINTGPGRFFYAENFNTLVGLVSIWLAAYLVARGQAAETAVGQARLELARISRATMMGELTASLAHEVNQPIAGVVVNASACLRWLGLDPPNIEEARQAASRIVRDGSRAADIVARVRAQFTRGDGRRRRTQLNRLVQDTIELVTPEAARHGAVIIADLADDAPEATIDPLEIQQVLVNLIVNAVEATASRAGPRRVTIRTRTRASGGAEVSVTDNGVGLPAETTQVFNPFFTTKSTGTGMGLAISRSLIEAHRGELTAAPNSPRGAIFVFTLPN